MKIKWTTITEDESTWPKDGQKVCINFQGDSDVLEVIRKGSQFTRFGQYFCVITETNKGTIEWRPMPKPSKKITAEDYVKMVSDTHTFDGAPQTIAGSLHLASLIIEMDKKVKKCKIEVPADIYRKLLFMTFEARDLDKKSKNWNLVMDNFIPVNKCKKESKTPIPDKLQDFKSEDARFLSWIHDRMEFKYGENRDFDYMIKLRNIIEKLEKLESPWKSAKDSPPKNIGMFLTRVKRIDGIYGYALSGIDDKNHWYHDPLNRNDFCYSRNNTPDEWMEIPE